MKRLSQTIYLTGKIEGEQFQDRDDVVEIKATIYVPKLNIEGMQVWRPHYSNMESSYALFQFDGDSKELENSTIRETCYGEFIEIGGTAGGATKSCIEKLIDKEWKVISGEHISL